MTLNSADSRLTCVALRSSAVKTSKRVAAAVNHVVRFRVERHKARKPIIANVKYGLQSLRASSSTELSTRSFIIDDETLLALTAAAWILVA